MMPLNKIPSFTNMARRERLSGRVMEVLPQLLLHWDKDARQIAAAARKAKRQRRKFPEKTSACREHCCANQVRPDRGVPQSPEFEAPDRGAAPGTFRRQSSRLSHSPCHHGLW